LKRVLLAIIFILTFFRISASEVVVVKYNSVPLNIALTQLSESYGISLSFDDRELSGYIISISGRFNSADEVIIRMLANLPLRLRKISGVWVISSVLADKSTDSLKIKSGDNVLIEGVVMDAQTGERLPYALLTLMDKRFYSDRNGYFSFKESTAKNESLSYNAAVGYLGYNISNVTLTGASLNRIFLTPVSFTLDTVLVRHYLTSRSFQSGDSPASVRINHAIAKYLPGNGDNSVFNLLRLMPGVRASGEPSFLSVWGSNEGESLVKMDGYRLFAMNNFNEQISSVNPFLVKEVRLTKGAFSVNNSGASGSVAEIYGIDGNSSRPVVKANINNLTANLFASAPTGSRSVVMAAYRQTYYNLYDVNKFNPYGNRPENSGSQASRDIYIIPDYLFRDANLRFKSTFGVDNTLTAGVYAAEDDFNYQFEFGDLFYDAKETNRQYAFSLNVNAKIGIPGKSDLSLVYSSNNLTADNISRYRGQNLISYKTNNLIGEYGAEFIHKIEVGKRNFIDFGLSIKKLFEGFNGDNADNKIYSFFINEKLVLDKFEGNVGMRLDSYLGKSYFQPRVAAVFNLGYGIKLNAAYGIHNQFSGKIPYIDYDGNFSYLWKLFNGANIPVIKSEHLIFGASYNHNGWLMSTEVFSRESSGILKFSRNRGNVRIAEYSANIKGVDMMINKEHNGSYIFVSTTISSVNEKLDNTENSTLKYNPAEIKAGLLLNFSPFFFSTTYVNGWGYRSSYQNISNDDTSSEQYSRLDISANYRFTKNRFVLNMGISILNLLNTLNYKYIDVVPNLPGGQSGYLNTYSQAIPFTPLLSLELNF